MEPLGIEVLEGDEVVVGIAADEPSFNGKWPPEADREKESDQRDMQLPRERFPRGRRLRRNRLFSASSEARTNRIRLVMSAVMVPISVVVAGHRGR